MKCYDCGGEIASGTDKCPSCGCPAGRDEAAGCLGARLLTAQLESESALDQLGKARSAMFAAALLALAWMAWRVAREQRERDPVLRAWRRLEKRYARRGFGRVPHEPAEAWARRLNGSSPEASPLLALTARFSEWRYALHERDPRRARRLLRDLRAHRPPDGER